MQSTKYETPVQVLNKVVNKSELVRLYQKEYDGRVNDKGQPMLWEIRPYEFFAKWYVFVYNKKHKVLKHLTDWAAYDMLADGAVTLEELQEMDRMTFEEAMAEIQNDQREYLVNEN